MKFLRHFAAVVLVIAVIVGLGMLWAHVSGGVSLRQPPPHEALMRLKQFRVKQINPGAIGFRPDSGFNLSNTSDLIQTCVIEAVFAAVAITASRVRRRHRRTRRSAASRA